MADAHQRMTRLNEAYEILGDTARRANYDRDRTRSQAKYASEEDNDKSEAFTSALNEVDTRWATACSIFPDLVQLRASLARINTSLAFSFVTSLLGSKDSTNRITFAAHLEQTFLERHFDSNQRILRFVRLLISKGNRAAVKELNQLGDVMGSDVDPILLIQRIEKKFGKPQDPMEIDTAGLVRARFLKVENLSNARLLAANLGYKVEVIGKRLFYSGYEYKVTGNNSVNYLEGDAEFIGWVRKELCS